MQAVKLFGGKRAVTDRMGELVRRHLSDIDEKQAVYLEEAFFLKSGTIEKIVKQQEKVDIHLFDRFFVPLGISLFDAFGSPEWGGEAKKEKEKWIKHKRSNWVANKLASTLATDLDIPLNVYVTLIAASELRLK